MAHGCRFGFGGRGRGDFGHRGYHGGPRFGLRPHPFHQHPFYHHVHVHEHGPFGQHILDTDATVIELAEEPSRQECIHEYKRGSKQVMKNSIDPVWTIAETKNGKFTISIVLGEDTKPEDVKLSVKERDLYIEIKMDKWSEDGTSHLTQVFTKKVALPEEVKVEDIQSNLTAERVLRIEAGVPVQEEISIPVNLKMEITAQPAEN